MKIKSKYFMGFFLVTAFILSSVSIIGQTNFVLASLASSSTNQALPVVDIFTGAQATDTLANMIADFNANYSTIYGFTVKAGPNYIGVPTSQLDMYKSFFQEHSSTIDIYPIDETWMAEFASAGYLLPLNDVFNSSYRTQFLQADVSAGTYNGKIYSVPWFQDSGMLYYRSDVLQYAFNNGIIPADRPPQTWSELTNWTLAMMHDKLLVTKFNITSGFVWQGRSYSGLLNDLMEYIGATGTYSILSSNQTGTNSFLSANQSNPVFENSTGIRDALQYMKSLITNGVSPKSVLNYDEEGSRAVWNSGNAIFMRNWPYAYPLSLQSAQLNGSLVSGADHNVQQFNVTAMPAENSSVVNPRTSCLGGWQLAVNAYSTHPNEAKRFIMWLTASKQQTTFFLGVGSLPSLKAVYNSPAILQSNGAYIRQFLPILESSIPQPITPDYQQIIKVLPPAINDYLGGGIMLEAAISNMTASVNSINNPIPVTNSLNEVFSYMVVALVFGLIVCIAVVIYYPQHKKRGLKEQGKKLAEQDSSTYTNVSKRVCTVCGSKLKSNELFCPNCGNRI